MSIESTYIYMKAVWCGYVARGSTAVVVCLSKLDTPLCITLTDNTSACQHVSSSKS